MTPEYLLDAVGLIDDDLIAEAEEPLTARKPAPIVRLRRWGGALAACLVLAFALNGVLTDTWKSNNSNSGASAPSENMAGGAGLPAGSAGSESGDGDVSDFMSAEPNAPEQSGAAASSQGTAPGEVLPGTILVENAAHGTSTYSIGRYVEELPQGAALVGELSETGPGAPSPSVDRAEYAGLELWMSADGTNVYVALPGGGWAEADLVEP